MGTDAAMQPPIRKVVHRISTVFPQRKGVSTRDAELGTGGSRAPDHGTVAGPMSRRHRADFRETHHPAKLTRGVDQVAPHSQTSISIF